MPVYEYKCEKCDRVFEKLIRNLSQTNPITCEACGGKKVTKLISAFAFSGSRQDSSPSTSASSCISCSHSSCSTCK